MRIIFLCGSLQLGKDGVGDYCLRLAFQLANSQNEVAIVALYDKGISLISEDLCVDNGRSFQTLRIPGFENNNKRFTHLQNFINLKRPDVISLQYVPYSFHSKGLPIKLSRYLKNLNGKFRWHIMFHELYIPNTLSLNKNFFISQIQIKIVKGLSKRLKPLCLHTSNMYYSDLLARIKLSSKILGLFSNIEGRPTNLMNTIVDFNSQTTAVYFASLPNENLWSKQLAVYSNTQFKKPLLILVCGFKNSKTENFVDYFKNGGFKIKFLEGLSSDNLLEVFSKASFGVSRVPKRLIGKSGAAVAMLEQGLPLWIPLVEDNSYTAEVRPELCFNDLNKLLGKLDQQKVRMERLPKIAEQFIRDLGI